MQGRYFVIQDFASAAPGSVPRTLRIPDLSMLKQMGVAGLCTLSDAELAPLGIKSITAEAVAGRGLRHGDIIYGEEAENGGLKIISVNGVTDKGAILNRPVITEDDSFRLAYLPNKNEVLRAGYPTDPWNLMCVPELEQSEIVALRVQDILAKFGVGMSSALRGAPQTGKSFLLRAEIKAWLQKTLEDPNLWVIVVYVGEREADDHEITKIEQSLQGKYAADRVLHFSVPDRASDAAQAWVCSYSVEIATALVASNKNVVVVMDSASRWLLAESSAPEIQHADTALISQGIKRGALGKLRRYLAMAGNYGKNRTLTMRSTMLWFPAEDPRARAYAEGVLASQISESTTNHMISTWPALDLTLRPALHMSPFASGVRMGNLICTPDQLEEELVIRSLMWGSIIPPDTTEDVVYQPRRNGGNRDSSTNPESALNNLISLATMHPFPPDTLQASGAKKWWKNYLSRL